MPASFPDETRAFPVTLPDGTTHRGTVFLNRVIDHPRMEIGDFTYCSDFDPPDDPRDFAARLAPYLFETSAERLVIGRFCQIAHGVRFISASANHAGDGISTYPFPVFDPAQISGYQPDRRDTVVGHDCWLGYGAMICPGAQIGNGVIVGAGAVVRGKVPDFAVVTGNPARVVRRRFDAATIDALVKLEWWNWPVDRIAACVDEIRSADIAALAAAAQQFDSEKPGNIA